MRDIVQDGPPIVRGWGGAIGPILVTDPQPAASKTNARPLARSSPRKGISEQVTAATARQEFKKYVRKVQGGSAVEILVHGRPAATMVSVDAGRAVHCMHGLFQEGMTVTIDGHIFTDLNDLADYFDYKRRFTGS